LKNLPASYTETAEKQLSNQLFSIKIAFLDVGQGDTTIISSSDTGEAIVVDCIDSEAVLDYLKQEKVSYLRGIIVTHLHQDHYIQVDDLLDTSRFVPGMQACEKVAFRIISKKHYEMLSKDRDEHQELGELFTIKDAKERRTTALRNMVNWCLEDRKRRHIEPFLQAVIQDEVAGEYIPISFEGTLARNIQLLHPYAIDLYTLEPKGLNNTSVVLRVLGPASSALLTGDLEPEGWRVLQAIYRDLHSDILKFPHHGGAWDTSNTKALLDAVQPSVVVISVGTVGEKYKHPNKEVFDVLSSPPYSHIRVLCTQATSQCQMDVSDQKQSIIQCLDQQAGGNSLKRIGSKRGCPCAGTIIVELGEKACVVQPTTAFHQEKVIRPHFRAHKCILAST